MRSPRNGAEIPVGAHPGNTGGKKGRSGRKPLAFKAFASSLARDPEFQEKLRCAALAGDIQAMKLVIQYAEGMPAQAITHSGEIRGGVLAVPQPLDAAAWGATAAAQQAALAARAAAVSEAAVNGATATAPRANGTPRR